MTWNCAKWLEAFEKSEMKNIVSKLTSSTDTLQRRSLLSSPPKTIIQKRFTHSLNIYLHCDVYATVMKRSRKKMGKQNEKKRSIEVVKHSFICMLIKQQYNHFIFHVVILNILRFFSISLSVSLSRSIVSYSMAGWAEQFGAFTAWCAIERVHANRY